MTNDKIQMTKEIKMTKFETCFVIGALVFVIGTIFTGRF